ncbi:phosphoenolpyruvate--protein phosphotransferase [Facklamia miroungae]|uniref:Phosphoenolpyruvate-protein phosphotransferase n=1 Tax=Facklamia miroungae TaxID=120956 RepID=A0A1G7UJ39_9LACT|nr:phosphoenolpyruvate--protein phosphotransferase [Facklamia miroungae]NKZ30082.1 phosphoenolpyruvate--protein phosphotransferase [Facklamia miroungae]SDG47556.1 phosphotransferase system, enzyme I, PtsI [Facklamia miroungae]
MTNKLTGIAASDGIAIAPVYLLVDPDLSFEEKIIEDCEQELVRLSIAVDQAKAELEKIRQLASTQLGEAEAQVFDAHLLVLSDPEFLAQIKNLIEDEKMNAEASLQKVADMFIATFEAMEDNPYMQERAADIRDVKQRLMAALLGVELPTPATIDHEVIVVARDLTPSDTAQLNKKYVKAFVTEIGGRTSHSAIMARSLEIPAIVGIKGVSEAVTQGQKIIVDAIEGSVILQPTESELKEYQDKSALLRQNKEELKKLVSASSLTSDGKSLEIAANIGTPQDVEGVIANGADGIGLYRTEFLYMNSSDFPSEDDQYQAYRQVLEAVDGKGVVVRTMDIGGDKHLPYMTLPQELNPFLGYRAIRISLDKQEMFKTQLRALLRASVHGDLKIMFPMIATLSEFHQAKAILEEAKEELAQAQIAYSDKIEVGIMVEIPAAAVLADQFAKEVDFFSIGTNDLIQYSMAADRMNEQVSYLYQPYNPSILRLVKFVIDSAHQEGKWVGMCGEMAGDQMAVPILVGMGLDEFSMSASSILRTRQLVSRLDSQMMKELAERVTKECSSSEEVLDLVKNYLAQ